MNIKIVFRVLLAAPILLLVIYALLPTVEYLWLSCDELSLLEAAGYNAVIPVNMIAVIVYISVWLMISIAMFFFISLSRIVYALFVFISMVLLALLGNRVTAPVENIVMLLLVLSVGAVLALMYSEATRVLFGKQEEAKDSDDNDEEDNFLK